MNQFFKQLAALLVDRQEVRLNITKIKDSLVILAVPNFKEEGKAVNITGTPEELDENFITEFSKPMAVINTFSSNAAEVAKEIEEDAADDAKSSVKKKTSAAPKKSAGKKTAMPKAAKKSAKQIKEEKNREKFDKLIGSSRAFIKENKFKDAIKNLTAALKILPKNEEAVKLLEEATEGAKANKGKSGPKPKEKTAEIVKEPTLEMDFKDVNAAVKDQAEEMTLATGDQDAKPGKMLTEGELPETIKSAEPIHHTELSGSEEITQEQKDAQRKEAEYNAIMLLGIEAQKDKDFAGAVKHFTEASGMFPENETAKSSLEKAVKLLDAFNLLNS